MVNMLGMTPIADKTSRITILFSWHCCFISNAKSWYWHCFSVTVACRLWVNWITMSMDLFYQSFLCLVNWMEQSCLLIMYDPSGVCAWHFPVGPAGHMVPQEDEVLSAIPDGKFWLMLVFVRNLG